MATWLVLSVCGAAALTGCGSSSGSAVPATTTTTRPPVSAAYCKAVRAAAASRPITGVSDPGLVHLGAFATALALIVPHAPAGERAFWQAEAAAVAAAAAGSGVPQADVAATQQGVATIVAEVEEDCHLRLVGWSSGSP
jgi:hypothetical protein